MSKKRDNESAIKASKMFNVSATYIKKVKQLKEDGEEDEDKNERNIS